MAVILTSFSLVVVLFLYFDFFYKVDNKSA